jgi:hypothetical protein
MNLLLEVPQLHIDFFVVIHSLKMFAKHLLQLLKSAIGMILYKVFAPFRDIISWSETKQVDDINFHNLPISSIIFLKTLMWASRLVSFMYVKYWNFRYMAI